MGTYRQKAIASLCLLLAVGAVATCSTLMRPALASASGNGSRQFIFGPVVVENNQSLFPSYFNTGTHPTPPATVVYRDFNSGEVLQTTVLPSIPPGVGTGDGISGEGRVYVVVVTFGRPAAGQAIPSPFPITLQVFTDNPYKAQNVLDPAR
jgi:hypothetical protein